MHRSPSVSEARVRICEEATVHTGLLGLETTPWEVHTTVTHRQKATLTHISLSTISSVAAEFQS